MIKLINLYKNYIDKNNTKIPALENINLSIANGSIFGIVGESGSGKSTLLKIINGIEQADSGELIIDDINFTIASTNQIKMVRKEISTIFQNFNLLGNLTVAENIFLPLKLKGEKFKNRINDIEKVLNFVNLIDKFNSYPASLSGGQQQRVAIARALIIKPKILLCDEATSSLDLKTTSNILTILKEINQHFNTTIVIVTHELDVIKWICHQVVILDKGKIQDQFKITNSDLAFKNGISYLDYVRNKLQEED